MNFKHENKTLMNSFSYKLLALSLGMVQSLDIEIETDLNQPNRVTATHLDDGLPFLNADPNTVTVSG